MLILLKRAIYFIFSFTILFNQSDLRAQILFEDVTASSGINHRGGSFGISWGDFDSDGWPDLWASNHDKRSSLYINQKDGTFVDIAQDILDLDDWADTHGAAWGDFDNDGDQDLMQLVGAQFGMGDGANQFLINCGTHFENRANDYGVGLPLGRGRTPLWFDWNNDGMLDLLVANTRRPDGQAPTTLFTQIPSGFMNDTEYLGAFFYSPHYIQIIDPSSDGNLEILGNGSSYPDHAYSINSIPFTDVTDTYNLPPIDNVQDTAIADFNGDLLPDLFLARGNLFHSNFLQSDHYSLMSTLTEGGGEKGIKFHTISEINVVVEPWWTVPADRIFIGASGYHPLANSFTLSPSDVTNFGQFVHVPGVDTGLFIGYEPSEQAWTILWSKATWGSVNLSITGTEMISGITAIGFEPSGGEQLPRLFFQSGIGNKDWSEQAILDAPLTASSVVSGDFDNDMDLDLYIVNKGSIVNGANVLYENSGNGNFMIVPLAGGAEGTNEGQGDCVAVADYDQNGFLDLLVTNGKAASPFNNGPDQLFRNTGNPNHWIEIDLEGVISNRDGVGTTIVASAGTRSQVRVQDGGMHSFSQNHQRVHFGLGSNTKVDELNIRWPSGIVQEIHDIPADKIIRVIEPVAPRFRGNPISMIYPLLLF